MRVAWLKWLGNGDTTQLPLEPSGQLELDAVAEHWKLDPSTLKASDLLLRRDRQGNSRLSLDEIASLLPPENNGLSKQTPLLITGSAAVATGPPAVPSLVLLTKGNMMAICNKYCERVKHVIELLPQAEAGYKTSYPSAVVDVCTLGHMKSPCLLWDGVGTGLIPLDQRFLDYQKPSDVTVVLAPSGSGKTRMLLEVASRRLCLFLTGYKPDIGGLAAASSSDVSFAVSWVEERLVLNKHDHPDEVLTFATGALLVSRLAILAFLRHLMPNLCARDWVFFQAEYPSVNDVFRELLECLLAAAREIVVDFPWSNFEMKDLVHALAAEVGWDGLVILDEAQTLLDRLQNTFLASSGARTNAVLIPLVGTISSFGCTAMFVSGTGGSMLKVREKFITGSMKTFTVREVYSLGGFSGADDVGEYMSKYIDTSALNLELLGVTYRGRRRWLVTAIEHYIQEVHLAGTETQFFINFAERILCEPGPLLGALRSLYEDAHQFWSQVTSLTLVDDLLVSYYLGGEGYVVVAEEQLTVNLIHCGLAPVFDERHHTQYDHVLRVHVCSGQKAILQEPLAVEALWRTRPKSLLGRAFAIHCRSASSLGQAFETYGFPDLGDGLDGKVLTQALGYDKPAAEIYTRTFNLVKSSAPPGFLVKTVGRDDHDFLSKWADDVEMNAPQFPTYIHLGDMNKCISGKVVGGPDGLFVMREVVPQQEQQRAARLLLVLVQFKTGDNVSMASSISSLDLDKLCISHKCPKLREWAKSGYVQIVMTTPLKERRPRPVVACSFGVPPLQVMIHGEHAISFVDNGVYEILKEKKENLTCKRRKIVL